MKHIKLLLYLLIPIVLCSCPEKIHYWTTPSTSELHCGSSLSNLTLQVSGNESWTITSTDWIYVNPSQHSNSANAEENTNVKLSVDPNPGKSDRTGELTLVGAQSGERHTIRVVQEGRNEPDPITSVIGETSFTFDQQGGSFVLDIQSNEPWTLTPDKNWCVPSATNGSGSAKIEVLVTANSNAQARESKLKLVGQNSHTEIPVTVRQDGTEQSASILVGKDEYGNDANIDNKTEYTLSVAPSALNFEAAGGAKNVSITGNDTWTASSGASWCTLSQTSGTGAASISVTASKNTATSLRSTTITIKGGKTGSTYYVTVDQAATAEPKPEFSVDLTSLTFASAGGKQSIEVSGNDTWTASSSASWCTLSRTSGTGAASISVSASKNTATSSRTATITLKGNKTSKTVTVSVSQTQGGSTSIGKDEFGQDSDINGSASYSFSAGPSSLSFGSAGGQQSIEVSGNDTWTAKSDATWCTLSRTSGTGAASISVTASKNSSTSSRSATITLIGSKTGKTVTIKVSQTQGGSTVIGKDEYDDDSDIDERPTYNFSASPSSLSFASAGGQQSIEVSGNDTWTASSSASWCTLSRTSGTGEASISVTASKNTNTSSRSATITLKGNKTSKTVTVSVSQSKGGSTVIGKGEFD